MQSFTLQFQPSWRLLILGLLFLPLLISLGFWQLDRADEKRRLLDSHQLLVQQAPRSINALATEELALLAHHTPVTFSGSYHQNRFWLLDNQTHQGRFGYRLLLPMQVADAWLLVDRGWLPGSADRRLPAVEIPQGERQLIGTVAVASHNPLVVADSTMAEDPRINAVNLQTLSEQSGLPLVAYVQLDAVSKDALVVIKTVVNILPEKHMAYAVQWFCMAMALLILLVFANTNLRERFTGVKPAKHT